MFLFGEGVEDQAVGFVEEVSQQIVGDGTLRADGVPVGLVHVVAGQDVFILPAEEVSLGGVELQGDVIRLVLIVQADGGEQFAADLIADPVSVRLQVLCDTGLLQEIVVDPGIWHNYAPFSVFCGAKQCASAHAKCRSKAAAACWLSAVFGCIMSNACRSV